MVYQMLVVMGDADMYGVDAGKVVMGEADM